MKLNKEELDMDFLGKLFEIMLNNFGVQGLYPYRNCKTIRMSKALGPLLDYNRKLLIKKIKRIMPYSITKLFRAGGGCDLKPLFDANKDLLMKVFRSNFVNKVLTKDEINEITCYPESNYRLIFHLVYIYLFNELFISGKFDTKFNEHYLDISLKEILNNVKSM